jgi:hypothetical protein
MSGKHHKPRWWRRRGAQRDQACRPRWSLTEIVDGANGCAHLMTCEAFEQGISEGTGLYQVLRGRQIAPPSSCCKPCVVFEPVLEPLT